MRRVTIALVGGSTLLVVAIGLALLHAPLSVARKNGTPTHESTIATTTKDATYCQAHELLPANTSTIRFWLGVYTGPAVKASVSAGGHTITGGERGSGWTGRVVAVPVKPLPRAVSDATVCVSFHVHDETVGVYGPTTAPAIAATNGREKLPGRMWIEYMRPGKSSWASLIPSVIDHMGLGRATSGARLVYVAIVLLAAIAAVASGLVLKELP